MINQRYRNIHNWVNSNWGRAKKCEACGANKSPFGQSRYFEWSNKDRKYSRNKKTWWQLCAPCHRYYDRLTSSYEPWNKGMKKERPEMVCEWCGQKFFPKRAYQILCSVKCTAHRNGDIRKRKANADLFIGK